MVNKQFNIGDEVYILHRNKSNDYKYVGRAIRDFIASGSLPESGVITDCWQSDDLSHHGSPYYETYYKVRSKSGKVYSTGPSYGGCGVELISKKSFILSINDRYKNNINKINELNTENVALKRLLDKARMIGMI